jgi:hypothetical protein
LAARVNRLGCRRPSIDVLMWQMMAGRMGGFQRVARLAAISINWNSQMNDGFREQLNPSCGLSPSQF